MAKRKKKQNRIPTCVEIMQSCRSSLAFSAIFRSGGGRHVDKRRAKARKSEWKSETF